MVMMAEICKEHIKIAITALGQHWVYIGDIQCGQVEETLMCK